MVNPLVRWRVNLVADLQGDILEIGVGKGENLAYYGPGARVWAIEPDLARAEHARQTAIAAGVPAIIDVAPAEALPYADARFDHVISSLVFCSVTDQRQALAEIARVLRPTGTLHMIEHVRPKNRLLATFFTRITPWWRTIAFNCHLDRPTIDLLRTEGWTVATRWRRFVFVRVAAHPPADAPSPD